MINKTQIEAATRMLLTALGHDPDDAAIVGTPDRVARAWVEIIAGEAVDPADILTRKFGTADEDEAVGYDQMVLLTGIKFWSTCEHHLLPFHGTAHVAYVPDSKGLVVGLSKLARLVEAYARRLQLQERMTKQIAGTLEAVLKPRGVAVVVRATHLCMAARGIEKDGASMVTADMRGVFRDEASARAELMAHIAGGVRC